MSNKEKYPKGKGYIITRLVEAIECIKRDLLGEARYHILEALDSNAELEHKGVIE